MKRLKILEQERELLLQGLEMVNEASAWYENQLSKVKERQQNLVLSDVANVSTCVLYVRCDECRILS